MINTKRCITLYKENNDHINCPVFPMFKYLEDI